MQYYSIGTQDNMRLGETVCVRSPLNKDTFTGETK